MTTDIPKKIEVTLEQIPELAKNIASIIQGGEVFGLIGNLGSGKTTFVKALGKELGVKSNISSPTFVLHNTYKGILPDQSPITIHHIDTYRFNTPEEFLLLDPNEWLGNPKTITLIEWADQIRSFLPATTNFIYFK